MVRSEAPLPPIPGPRMFESAKVDIQGGEFINANRDVIKLVVNSGQDVVETIRATLPILLEEIQKIRLQSTSDGKNDNHGSANKYHAPSKEPADPVVIETTTSAPSTLLEIGSVADKYTRSMLKCLAGYPLYVPQPYNDLSEEYSRKGIRVGDLGIITKDGAFEFLFNICPSQNGLINPRKLPKGFTLEVSQDSKIQRKEQFPLQTHLFESPIIRKKNLFRCPRYISLEPGGAILELPTGAFLDDATSKLPFRRLAVRRGVKWYKYTIGARGKDVLNGSLYLVTSCTKCTQWGIAVFDRPCTPQDSLRFVQNRGLFRQSGSKYSWKGSSAFTTKLGPSSGSKKGDKPNQCVFVQGYKIMLRQDIFNDLMNDELHHLPQVPTSSQLPLRTGMKSTRAPNLPPVHPSDLINATLLSQVPNAKVAVTHDDDWCDLMRDIIHDPKRSSLAKIAQSYTSSVDKYGCVSFEKIQSSPVIQTFDHQDRSMRNWTTTSRPPPIPLSNQVPINQTSGWQYSPHNQTPMYHAVRDQKFSTGAPPHRTRKQEPRPQYPPHRERPAYQTVHDQPFPDYAPMNRDTRQKSVKDSRLWSPEPYHQSSGHAVFSNTMGQDSSPPIPHQSAFNDTRQDSMGINDNRWSPPEPHFQSSGHAMFSGPSRPEMEDWEPPIMYKRVVSHATEPRLYNKDGNRSIPPPRVHQPPSGLNETTRHLREHFPAEPRKQRGRNRK